MAAEMTNDVSSTVLGELIGPELARWKVPGLEVAVVHDDQVLFAGGFGSANVAIGAPVEPTTLFHHGSTGKMMTSLLAAILVEEGLLEWDRPVRDYLPEFRLVDTVLTERVTIRDLLAHRTGVAGHDFVWFANPSWTREELVRRLRYLDIARDLRTGFVYWNYGYAVAGHVMGVVTGSTWEEQLRARILEPLGMSSAVTSIREAEEGGKLSRAYEVRSGKATEVAYRAIGSAAPAGEILYCATDSATWLRFQANDGELDGRRLVSEDLFRQLRTVQVPFEFGRLVADEPSWSPRWLGLGLGPALGIYRDRLVIFAQGGIDGFSTCLIVVPEERIGILVAANVTGSGLPLPSSFHLTDLLMGHEPRPWLEKRYAQSEQRRLDREERATKVRVVPGTAPSHSLDDYVGIYEDSGYGELRVSRASETELACTLGELNLSLSYRHYDTWMANLMEDLVTADADVPLTFVTDAEGVVAEVVAPLEPMTRPIRFTRRNTAD